MENILREEEAPAKYTAISQETMTNVNSTVFLIFLVFYVFRRSVMSSTPALNIIKGRLGTLGSWMLNFSALFLLVFSLCVTFLSQVMPIRRNEIETTMLYDKSLISTFKNYHIDMVALMLFSLKLSRLLLGSSLFTLVALVAPRMIDSTRESPDRGAQHSRTHKNPGTSSISSFSITWALLRIPLYLYFDTHRTNLDYKTSIFVTELVCALEFLLVAVFLLILQARRDSSSVSPSSGTVSLFILLCSLCAVFRHVVNLIDLPFILTELHGQILGSIQFALQLSIYLLASCMFCPSSVDTEKFEEDIIVSKPTEHYEMIEAIPSEDILLMPAPIEYNEHLVHHE